MDCAKWEKGERREMGCYKERGGKKFKKPRFNKWGGGEKFPPPPGGHRLVSRKEWLQKKESCGKGRVTGKNVVEKMRVMILGWVACRGRVGRCLFYLYQ